ncbi:MAG: hypothetical protein V4602_17180 [Pseudomonadota bacterium]
MADSIIAHRSVRSRTSRCAHVIERFGLSMAGASCGLFVAAHVSSARVEALGSVSVSLALMVLGAIGFYLGIDVPPHRTGRPSQGRLTGEDLQPMDPVELLSAAGTFLAATAAFVSVYSIVTDSDMTAAMTVALACGWLLGVTMQIVAGATARIRHT